jgi:predicted membrane-bound spermidine synthase
MKQLDNAEIFFDVQLYVGLFGTVSAFLVMTFSPQSSRLIAYSSTLIGIIFSLVLRVTVQYPLRKKLILAEAKEQSLENSKSNSQATMENDK